MNIGKLKTVWDRVGREDPLWAILGDPLKKGGKWDLDGFFETGIVAVDRVMDHLGSLGVKTGNGKALDFGCGVGRLTRSLLRYFDQVYGVDLAPSMIDLAVKYNGHLPGCRFYANAEDNLGAFGDGTFDFIYSSITLQHIAPRYAENYIREFLRLLVPGGGLVFQIPSEPSGPLEKVKLFLRGVLPVSALRGCLLSGRDGGAAIEMHGIKRDKVVKIVEGEGGRVVDIQEDQSAGSRWISLVYYVVKG